MKKMIKRVIVSFLILMVMFSALPNVPQPVHAAERKYRIQISMPSIHEIQSDSSGVKYVASANTVAVSVTVKKGTQVLVSNENPAELMKYSFPYDPEIVFHIHGGSSAGSVDAEIPMSQLSFNILEFTAYGEVTEPSPEVFLQSQGDGTIRFHTHQWTYTSKDNWIQAVCTDTLCPSVPLLHIEADPKVKEYNGEKTVARLTTSQGWEEDGLVVPNANQIQYTPANSANIGEYTASITLNGKTASTTFKITKININPEVNISDWTYGGTPSTLTLKSGSNPGGGTVTYQYKKVGEADSEYKSTVPTEAGDYTVRATIAEKGNYFGGTATKDFKILPKDLIVTIPAGNKTYNGNTEASLKFTEASFTGLVGTDSVSVSSANGSFADKNAGPNKTVTISGIVLSGEKASNYNPVPTNTSASITPKMVTVNSITASDKVYDGNLNATLVIGESSIGGKVSGDNLSLSATGAFIDKNVGTGKEVTISGLTLTGTDASNYVLAASGNQDKTSANITEKEVSLSWSDTSLTYNGSEQKPKAEAGELIAGDECEVTVDGAKKDAGDYEAEAKALSNSNYKLPANTKTAFNISKAPITITAEDKESVYGDPTEELIYKVSSGSIQGSDTLDIKLESEASSSSSVGNYDITAAWNTEDGNYEATFEKGTYSIVPREAEFRWAPLEFTYNGYEQSPSAEVSNLANGDSCDVTVVGAGKGAGEYEAEATALGNANYRMPTNNKTPFTIKPKEITEDMLSVTPDTLEGEGDTSGPSIIMTDKEVPDPNMVLDADYTATGSLLGVVPGTQFVKIEGRGNYTGVLNTSWVLYKEKAAQDELPGEGGAGDFEVFVVNDPDAPAISFENFDVELAKTLLSDEEMARYLGGEDVQVYIQVRNLKDGEVPADDKAKISALFGPKGVKDIAFFDITLWKKIGVGAAIKIEDTEGKNVEMKVIVPEEEQDSPEGYDRSFYAAHVHGGVAKILAETDKITVAFNSGEFSTYALGLKDTRISNPKYTDIKDEDGNPVTPETPLDEDGDEPKVGDKFKGDDDNEYEIISISEPDPDTDIVTVIVRKIEVDTPDEEPGEDPGNTEPENTEPKNTDPGKNTEPENTDPEKEETENTEPKNTDPEKEETENTEPENTDPASEPKNTTEPAEKPGAENKSDSAEAKKPTSAKTGDESNLLLWLTILSVAAIGVGVARKKRKA